MGLDMYLEGRKFLWTDRDKPEVQEDGFRLKGRILELGYWRKHPNLHGFIVETFADGKDECQDIELSEEHLRTILAAVKKDDLPHTQGFFFGESRPEDKPMTIETLEAAIKWVTDKSEEPLISRYVVYRASW